MGQKITKNTLNARVNPELNKYANIVLAPEKVEKAKKVVAGIDFKKFKKLVAEQEGKK